MGVGVRQMHRDAKARTAVSKVFDLSGAAGTDSIVLDMNCPVVIDRVDALYTEASSADAGIATKVGIAGDDDAIATYTSEVSVAIDTTKPLTLLGTLNTGRVGKPIVAAGKAVTFASAGGKTGVGELRFVVTYFPFRQQSNRYT